MAAETSGMTKTQTATLMFSVLAVALCGIVYELLIATVSSYLIGDSVRQFSITIGLFMAAMGLGAYATRYMEDDLVARFVVVEILVALVGGLSTLVLFLVFPWSSFYEPTMHALIMAVGSLVGMEIPLLARVLSESGGIRRSIAETLSLDYAGALIGSVAFPLVLLPFLGIFRSSFAIGLFNSGVALLNVFVFSSQFRHPRRQVAMAAAVFVLLASAFALSERATAFAEGQLYADRIVFSAQTPYQKIVLTREDGSGRHRLYLDGHIQFAEADEYRYHEALVHPALSASSSRAHVLVLGGGDGLAAREVLKYGDAKRITLVDIDPAMTKICSTLVPLRRLSGDSLRNGRLDVRNVDAFQFLRRSRELFDCVIIDLPDPHNEALSKLYSVEFYRLLLKRLAPSGLVVSQSTSPLMTRETFWAIGRTMGAAGFAVFRYQVNVPSFSGDWGFTIAGRPGQLPAAFSLEQGKTRFLTSEVMASAGVFAADEQPQTDLVNSMFEPKLYLTYNREVSQW